MKKCPNCGSEATDEQFFCQHCGTRLEDEIRPSPEIKEKETSVAMPQKLEKKWRIILGLSISICIFSTIFAWIEFNEAKDYRQRYYSANSDRNELKELNSAMNQQVDFMNQYIAIIDSNSDDNLYHTYACDVWDNWSDEWSILAYNTHAADDRGYEPCPECHD